ncbi:AAA family ATPase [[Mycoplasma] mobile]|uniref:Predicted ATPase n=1 Tax=Mycoplasma mobile (strain ATCC 43663 / 163K / NCTC 11711) TaxID=267748 RepID=Q6KHW6_MYCM1|nr:AAA family ATPase [[Mycoplasma] mobile]AAT27810.1 predicted ATPase [Mycoplasma mobile 163K]
MQIKSLYINNYKKFQDRFFHFRKMNSIIGPNNSGKSTLLEIILSFLKQDVNVFEKFRKTLKTKSFNQVNEMKIVLEKEVNNIPYNFSFYLNCRKEIFWDLIKVKNLYTNEKIYGSDLEQWLNENKLDSKIIINSNDVASLSAHTNYHEIENVIKQSILTKLYEKHHEEISKIKNFVSNFSNQSLELKHQKMENNSNFEEINYDVFPIFDFEKAIDFKFDTNNPNSIANKGLGEQKQFVLDQYLGTQFLIIDEIENSLSIKTLSHLIKVLQSIKNETQIFYTTHNGYSLVFDPDPEIEIISLGDNGTISTEIFCEIRNLVFCEGISDVRVFKDSFPHYSFIQSNGSNIVHSVKGIIKNTKSIPKVIVDGDNAGNRYYDKFTKSDENDNIFLDNTNIHILSRPTIEDFVENKKNLLVNFIFNHEIIKNNLTDESIQYFHNKFSSNEWDEAIEKSILNFIKNILNELFRTKNLRKNVSLKNINNFKKTIYSKLKVHFQKNVSSRLIQQELENFLK